MINYKETCAVCFNKLDKRFCSDAKCMKDYYYEVNDNFADFYLNNFIVEYYLTDDGDLEKISVIRRSAPGISYSSRKVFETDEVDDLDPIRLVTKLEKLQSFL